MRFNKRDYFKNVAKETLDIIDKGYYTNKNRSKIELRELIDNAIKGTELICESKNKEFESNENNINISIVNNTTIDTIIELRQKGISENIIALNFASAKNPGGGFQTGANAQEESIARASALYPNEFYEYHKGQRSPLYSDKMIYSPNVPIFRDDKGKYEESN